ncbi:MAG: hypothetical protein KF809_00145 [Chloroflexi bacterium]|nr:hypothetical protein [Chloroflexota bacterium]
MDRDLLRLHEALDDWKDAHASLVGIDPGTTAHQVATLLAEEAKEHDLALVREVAEAHGPAVLPDISITSTLMLRLRVGTDETG